jgi:hypothetical protein
MTDRELLEAAARAAGIHWENWTPTVFAGEAELREWPYGWNPLADDGDALRLMVKLEIAVNPFAGKTVVAHNESGRMGHEKWDCCDDDPYAATRRAIVRAAAEIGGRDE